MTEATPCPDNATARSLKYERTYSMKSITLGPLAVALLIIASMTFAGPAGATTILPAKTAVSGLAPDWTLTYGGSNFTCTKSTAIGTTANPASASLSLTFDFYGTCTGFGNTYFVTCNGTTTFAANATGGGTGNGRLALDTGFTCSVTVKVFGSSVCSLTFTGPQTLAGNGTTFTAATTKLNLIAGGIAATRDAGGSALCGPASATASMTATYNFTPTTLTITNP
jgi:hypothetical protein